MNLGGLPRSFKIFAEENFDEILRQRMNDLYNSIQQMNRNEFLNANEPELIESYVETFTYEPVAVDFESITMSEKEGYRKIRDFGEIINQKGLYYTFHLQVSGELAILRIGVKP